MTTGTIHHAFFLLAVCLTVSVMGAPPATGPSDSPLPPGGIRRLGDLRFATFGRMGSFSLDGQRIAIPEQELGIWNTQTALQVCKYRAVGKYCADAKYINDHELLVAWAELGKPTDIVLMNDLTGKPARRICTVPGAVNELAVTVDGTYFAVRGDHLMLCKGVGGEVQHDFGQKPAGPNVPVSGQHLCFSSDKKTLMLVDFNGEAQLIDVETGNPKSDHHYPAPLGAAMSPDGKLLATIQDDKDLHLYDVATAQEIDVPEADPVKSTSNQGALQDRGATQWLSFAPTGNMLAIAKLGPGWITLLDTSKQPLVPPRVVHCDFGSLPTWSNDAKLLMLRSESGRPMLVNAESGLQVSPASTSMNGINAMTVSPDGENLVVGARMGEMYMWDLEQGNLLVHRDRKSANDFVMQQAIRTISYIDDSTAILVAGTNDARICNPQTLVTTRRLTKHALPGAYQGMVPLVSPDGRYSVNLVESKVSLTDIKSNQTSDLAQADYNHPFRPTRFSPDDSMLEINTGDGLHFMNLSNKQLGPPVWFNYASESVMGGEFSPDGRWVALQSGIKIGVFDSHELIDPQLSQAAAKEPSNQPGGNPRMPSVNINPMPGPRDSLPHAAPMWTVDVGTRPGDATFSSSGELIAISRSSTPNQTNPSAVATLYETRTGKVVAEVAPSFPPAQLLRFVPGRLEMLTSGGDGTVLVWDLQKVLADKQSLADQSDDDLWKTLSTDDPAAAYRSGLELLQRKVLASRASGLKPLPGNPTVAGLTHIGELIKALSSENAQEREKAHKALEAAGPAAIPEVRTALNTHPGGETEARLSDIARVIGVDDPDVKLPAPTTAPVPINDPQTLLTGRVIQLLEWSTDPAAKKEYARLRGAPAAPPK